MTSEFPPRRFLWWSLCVLLSLSRALWAEEVATPEPYRSLPGALQAKAATFPKVQVTEGNQAPVTVEVDLRPTVVPLPEGYQCGAIRFKAPDQKDLDMVWAFSAPAAWQQWYILPVSGPAEAGFQNWLDADRVYRELPPPPDAPLRLQTLEATRLKPGKEYLLWFMAKKGVEGPVPLRVRIHFARQPEDSTWDNEHIVKALGLTEAPVEDQVKHLKSRGGRILLDQRYFEAGYAKGRIDSVLLGIRMTTSSGGFYSTLMTSIPNCRTTPSLMEIQMEYGPADIVLTGADRKALDPELEDADLQVSHAHYDYLTFVFENADSLQKVIRVETKAFDSSSVLPQRDGLTFADLMLPQASLRVFYKDRKEVGRIAHWGRPEAKVLRGEIPSGTYERSLGKVVDQLVHAGGGSWEAAWITAEGQKLPKSSLKNHAYDGMVTEYYESGEKKIEAEFKKGEMNGKTRYWDEKGELLGQRTYKDGELIESP